MFLKQVSINYNFDFIYDIDTCRAAAIEQGYETEYDGYDFDDSWWSENGCGYCPEGS